MSEELTPRTPEEIQAEIICERIRAAGFHAEYGTDTHEGTPLHYALVMPKVQYDAVLREQTELFHGLAQPDFVQAKEPPDFLYWETLIHQPTFCSGQASPVEALWL